MDTYNYKEVNQNSDDKIAWKPFLRQVSVCSAAWLLYFLSGLSFGAPTVFIPQIRKEVNSTFAMTDDMESWLYSVFGYCGLPWIIIICLTTKRIGRKIPFAVICLNTLLYNIVLYFSNNAIHILISEIMQGVNHASNMTLSVIIVSEYTSPKYRGVFLAIKSASLFWGIWLANAIGTFFYWKYIGLVGIILSFYSFSVLFWPESPYWLASQQRFDECKKSHRWLKGTSKKSEEELESLIQSQMKHHKSPKKYFSRLFTTLKSKSFYKPVSLSIVMMLQYHLSGKVVYAIYAIEIIKKITDNESMAYRGMLIMDGVTVAGMYFGCVLAKFIKRRKLLLTAAILSIIFLFILSLYLYFIKLKVIDDYKTLTIMLLMLFSLCISCGPMVLSTSIYGEITPLRYKSSSMIISALTFVSLTSTLLKLSPYIFKGFGMHGTFLFFGVCSFVCWLFLFFYLPETKDKTLQEIEEYFCGGAKINEMKELECLKNIPNTK